MVWSAFAGLSSGVLQGLGGGGRMCFLGPSTKVLTVRPGYFGAL